MVLFWTRLQAADMIEKLLVPVEEGANEHKRLQLRELASLNGGSPQHPSSSSSSSLSFASIIAYIQSDTFPLTLAPGMRPPEAAAVHLLCWAAADAALLHRSNLHCCIGMATNDTVQLILEGLAGAPWAGWPQPQRMLALADRFSCTLTRNNTLSSWSGLAEAARIVASPPPKGRAV